MERLYRFELAFDGEPQRVGFLQGLADIGLWYPVEVDLYAEFDILPAPKLEAPELNLGEKISFWFTEDGLNTFESAINRVADEIAEKNWQLLGSWMEADIKDSIYHDQYQAAFSADYMARTWMQLVEVENIDGFKQLAVA